MVAVTVRMSLKTASIVELKRQRRRDYSPIDCLCTIIYNNILSLYCILFTIGIGNVPLILVLVL